VVARNTNLQGVRTPSRLELSYLQTAGELAQMIANGTFPYPGQRSDHADSPRVGDGFIRVDPDGLVEYASPNAMSVYRKLGLVGDLAGQHLADVTRGLVPARLRPDEETISAVLAAGAPRHRGGNGAASDLAPSRCADGEHRRPGAAARRDRTCAVATASWSPRKPPSARSTTG
jgi:hypothetical protein